MSDSTSIDLETGFAVLTHDPYNRHAEGKVGIVIKITSLVWLNGTSTSKPPDAWIAEVLVENEIRYVRVERRDILAAI